MFWDIILLCFLLGLQLLTLLGIGSAHEGLYVPASKSFLGVDGYHDFNYILNTFGILSFSGFISFLVKVIAHLVMIYACCKIFLYSLLDR